MTFELRYYQRDSLDAFYDYCGSNDGNPLIVLPTGSGKSLVIAQLCQEVIQELPHARIAIVTHVKELIKQDYGELLALWPSAPAGIYSAGLRRRDAGAQIVFGGVQSMVRRIGELGSFDLMIVDEAHLVPHDDDTSYRKLIAGLRMFGNGNMRVLGLTATAFRLASGRLDRGDNALFDAVVHEVPVAELIEKGFLCKLISKATLTKLDTKGVGTRGGEFIPHELEIAVDQEWITRGAVEEIVKYGENRKAWLVFCSGIRHARHVAEAIQEKGVSCETIFGNTPREDRDFIIEDFRAGRTQCLVSVMVLGTGFNVPHVDMIALMRPTKSAGLFLQQVGRGLRKANGKTDCLVLDFAGLVKRHGPIDTITADNAARESKTRDDDADRCKECPECHSQWPHGTEVCEDCGYIFPVKKKVPTHEASADSERSILSADDPDIWLNVTGLRANLHHKRHDPTATPTLRISYQCGVFTEYSEYLNFEKEGARYWARKKWFALGGQIPAPDTAQAALVRSRELSAPNQIKVRRNGQYWNVVAHRSSKPVAP